jgi:fimbrial chaperone protein
MGGLVGRFSRASVFLLFVACVGVHYAAASTLSVSPLLIDRAAPASAATLTLSNAGTGPINVQIRVFRWEQTGGVDHLVPTRDVVVSPPMMPLAPGVDYTVRVVRLTKAPVSGEESYRVLVDELPTPVGENGRASVAFVVRYSIPAFFRTATASAPQVDAHLDYRKRRLSLVLTNRGGTRLKVSGATLTDSAGRRFVLSQGLLGYVLAGATMRWTLAVDRAPRPGGARLQFTNDGVAADVPIVLRTDG